MNNNNIDYKDYNHRLTDEELYKLRLEQLREACLFITDEQRVEMIKIIVNSSPNVYWRTNFEETSD